MTAKDIFLVYTQWRSIFVRSFITAVYLANSLLDEKYMREKTVEV